MYAVKYAEIKKDLNDIADGLGIPLAELLVPETMAKHAPNIPRLMEIWEIGIDLADGTAEYIVTPEDYPVEEGDEEGKWRQIMFLLKHGYFASGDCSAKITGSLERQLEVPFENRDPPQPPTPSSLISRPSRFDSPA